MYLVVIAWLYVAVMMALAEAFSGNGTVLGAIVTFFLYGLLPISLVVYLMGTPLRRIVEDMGGGAPDGGAEGAP
jgi:mannose/fructose/N-acetylgalactosamine-specific phosphotransferase system component IID